MSQVWLWKNLVFYFYTQIKNITSEILVEFILHFLVKIIEDISKNNYIANVANILLQWHLQS